jgi:tetratricopeptide (TPR) repeat protein
VKKKVFLSFQVLLILFVFSDVCLFPSTSQKTIWDRIMAEQSELNISRGVYFMNAGNYSKASIEFLMAIEKNPSSMAYTMYGASLYWMGDNEGAISNYDKAISMDLNNDIAWQLKGISLARDMKLKDSLDCFKKAMEINPNRGDVLMNIGSVYFSLNNITDAISYLKRAIKVDSSNSLYYYQLGLIYFSTGDYYKAIENFDRAYSLKSDYEDAVLWLGISYEKSGDIKKAQKFYKKAVSLKPYDFFARYKLARLEKIPKNLENIIEPCFGLTRNDEKGGIPLQISYSVSKFDSSSDYVNPATKSLYENLIRIDENEDATVSVDIIEMKNFTLEKNTGAELKKNLQSRFNPLTYSVKSKTYSVSASSLEERKKQIKKITDDINSLLKNDADYRINFNIQTHKKAEANEQQKNDLTYIPRNVGNDMGLWIIGNPWIAVIEEDIENSNNFKTSTEKVTAALGMLLIGDLSGSENLFMESESDLEVISYLGRGVISFLNGDRETAIKYFDMALKKNPSNKIAKKNIMWLNENK